MVKETTKERILDAALEIFGEKGFVFSTTREIADRAGVNEVTLFRHFGSKENLFREGMNRITPISTLTDDLDRHLTGDLHADLRFLAESYLGIAQRRLRYIKVAIAELTRHPELVLSVAQVLKRLSIHLDAHLNRLHRQGAIPKANFRLIAEMFYTLLFQYVLVKDVFKSALYESTLEDFVETCASVFVRGIGFGETVDGRSR